MIDPVDYTLRWPNHIVADEVQQLLSRAETEGVNSDWRDEVDRLLRQAFVSTVPVEDFEQAQRSLAPDPVYGDEEPF